MKRIRLLCSISLLFAAGTTNAQSFFQDSTAWYVFRKGFSITQGISYFASFYKESITLDSVSGQTEYYRVQRRPLAGLQSQDSVSYRLSVKDSIVYFSGDARADFDSIIHFNELRLFDYKLQMNDTISIEVPGFFDCKYLPDSVRIDSTVIGNVSKKFYFSGPIQDGQCGNHNTKNEKFAFSSIGFDTGLIPFEISSYIDGRSGNLFLISVCSKNQMIYADSTSYFFQGFQAFCNEDSIISLAQRIIKADIPEMTSRLVPLYPNPATDRIFISDKQGGRYFIFNAMGQQVKAGTSQHEIRVDDLLPGIYFLRIEAKGRIGTGKFIVE